MLRHVLALAAGNLLLSSGAVAAETTLLPGVQISQGLSSGQIHSYRFAISANECVHLWIDQRDLDVAIRVSGDALPAGARYDGFEDGWEALAVTAAETGDLIVTIEPVSKKGASGKYTIRAGNAHAPQAGCDLRAEAMRIATNGKTTWNSHTPDGPKQAFALYSRAAQLWERAGEQFGELAAQIRSGDLLFLSSDYRNAVQTYRLALPLAQSLKDARSEAELHNNIALNEGRLGEIAAARREFEEAIRMFRAQELTQSEGVALSNRGVINLQSSDWDAALRDLYGAQAALRKSGDLRLEAFALNNIAFVHIFLHDYFKALDFLTQARDRFLSANDKPAAGRASSSLGRVYLALNRPDEAVKNAEKGLALLQGLSDKRSEAEARNNLGLILAETGRDRAAAKIHFKAALRMFQEVQDRRGEANALEHLGEWHLVDREFYPALRFLNGALALRREVGLWDGVASTLYSIAIAQRSIGRSGAALKAIKEAVDVASDLRVRVASDRLRSLYRAGKQDYYRFYVDLLMEFHQRDPSRGYDRRAFEASEQSRALSLVEALGGGNSSGRDGPSNLLRRKRELQEVLNFRAAGLAAVYERPRTKAAEDAARKAFETAAARLEQLESQLRPLIHEKRYAALGLAAIQNRVLDSKTTLVEYSILETTIAVWIVTPTSFRSLVVPNRKGVEEAVRAVRLWIEKPHRGGFSLDPAIANTLGYLRLALLGSDPLADRQQRLLIVPEGILHQFPFAVLPQSTAGEYIPIVNTHELVILPSASVGGMIHARPARAMRTGRIAVFADPLPAREVSTVQLAAAPIAAGSGSELPLPPLIFSRQEGDSIAEIWPNVERYFGVRATPDNAMAALKSGFSIVHFAVHGLARTEPPFLAGLVFSQVDPRGQSRNGYLDAERIVSIRTRASLIVASACDTGSGGDLSGEGVMSLTRAFLYAGAPSVIASLWKVDDSAALHFMRNFYDLLLKRGLAPAAALRETQKAMWDRPGWSDPRLWANFQAYGDWR